MKDRNKARSNSELWGEFRFSVIGNLLASPPQPGELRKELEELSGCIWQHPITGEQSKYSFSTIERWYYRCLKEKGSPVEALKRQVRKDNGQQRVVDEPLINLIREQYQGHRSWSYKLHSDNIQVQLEEKEQESPSYATIRRCMQSQGLFKQKRKRNKQRAGVEAADERIESREVRSYEAEYVGGLWHLDFHHCSRQVLTADGNWITPVLLSIMDDHSRLVCHLQWYEVENTQNLVHGFSQAIQKRGLPRALMSDNGPSMTSAEFTTGLLELGIQQKCTLPYSPYQNGKQETLFASVEGRLMAMLENCKELTIDELNEATQAWYEMEYNRTDHKELD